MQTDPVQELRARAEQIAADPQLDPGAKSRKLTALRDDVAGVAGVITQHLGDAELTREAQTSVAARQKLRARENATIRETLLARGDASEEQLDEMGYVSHAELDRLGEEGLLEAFLEGTATVGGPGSEEQLIEALETKGWRQAMALLEAQHGWERDGEWSPGEALVLLKTSTPRDETSSASAVPMIAVTFGENGEPEEVGRVG